MGTGGAKNLTGKKVLHNIVEHLNFSVQAHAGEMGNTVPHPFFKNTAESGVYSFKFGDKKYLLKIEEAPSSEK